MKFFAYLKKLNKLGASMVEYAIVLACISAFGASFSDNLTNVLEKPFNSIATILGVESGGSQTVTAVQKLAYSLFTDETKTKSDGGNRFDSFYMEFVSGAGIFMEKHLKDAGIETLWVKDNIAYSEKNQDSVNMFQSLWDNKIIPESTKSFRLLTIADDKNVAPTMNNQFSATQYLLYSAEGKVHLAATRNFSSLYVSQNGVNGIITAQDIPNKSYENKYNAGAAKIVGTNTKVNYIDPNNHGFVKYEP